MLFNPVPNLPLRLGISDFDVVSSNPTTWRATLMVSLKFSGLTRSLVVFIVVISLAAFINLPRLLSCCVTVFLLPTVSVLLPMTLFIKWQPKPLIAGSVLTISVTSSWRMLLVRSLNISGVPEGESCSIEQVASTRVLENVFCAPSLDGRLSHFLRCFHNSFLTKRPRQWEQCTYSFSELCFLGRFFAMRLPCPLLSTDALCIKLPLLLRKFKWHFLSFEPLL